MPEGYALYNAQEGAASEPLDLPSIQKAAQSGASNDAIKSMLGLLLTSLLRRRGKLGPENRARGIYPDSAVLARGLATRGESFTTFDPAVAGNATDSAFCDSSSPLYDPQLCALATGRGSLGGTAAIPPVTDLLGEMRLRREAEATQANIISNILMANIPRGQKYYPGLEPNGLADVLLGIITGNGPEAAKSILPESQRIVRRTDVNVPLGQPSVASEFGQASDFANQILSGAKVIQ